MWFWLRKNEYLGRLVTSSIAQEYGVRGILPRLCKLGEV